MRLFQSGGVSALAHFGVNRILIMEPENGNRICCDIRAMPFAVYAETSHFQIIVTPIIP